MKIYLTIFLFTVTSIGCKFSGKQHDTNAVKADEMTDDRITFSWIYREIAQSQIKSIEGLLERIHQSPYGDEVLSRWLLVYNSRSQHYSDTNTTENVRQPRLILFSQDASLILGISGNKTDPNYNLLEVIQYDFPSSEFHFLRVDFTNDGQVVVFDSRQHQDYFGPEAHDAPGWLKHEPKSDACEGCHNGSPNWDSYPTWQGVYGSSDDQIYVGSKEDANFREVLRYRPNHPRLKYLREIFTAENIEALVKEPNAKAMYRFKPNYYKQNSSFTNLVDYLNYYRMAKAVLADEHLKHHRFALMAAVGDCKERARYLPDYSEEAFERLAKEVHSTRRQYQLEKLTEISLQNKQSLEMDFEAATNAIAAAKWIFDRYNFPLGAWNINFNAYSLDFVNGDGELYVLGRYLARLSFENEKPPLHKFTWGYHHGNWPKKYVTWNTGFQSAFPLMDALDANGKSTNELCIKLYERHDSEMASLRSN